MKSRNAIRYSLIIISILLLSHLAVGLFAYKYGKQKVMRTDTSEIEKDIEALTQAQNEAFEAKLSEQRAIQHMNNALDQIKKIGAYNDYLQTKIPPHIVTCSLNAISDGVCLKKDQSSKD